MKLRSLLVMLVASSMMLACTPDYPPTTVPSPRITPAPTPSPTPLVHGHYFDDMISFNYPTDWNDGQFWYPSSVSILKLMASTEELRPPCVQSGSAVLCRSAVEELTPGGLLVSWWRWGLTHGDPGPDPTAGELIHVGGRSARISDAGAEGHCLNIKSDQALRVEIPDPTLSGSWTVIDACLREPVADVRAAFDDMLRSIEWLGPQPTQVVGLRSGEFDSELQLYDDTGLVAEAKSVLVRDNIEPVATVAGTSLRIEWTAGPCARQPILGLSQAAGRLLILLQPGAGAVLAPPTCPDVVLLWGIDLTLSQTVDQDDVHLEVW